MRVNWEDLRRLEAAFQLTLSVRHHEQIGQYLELLEKWNRKINLTSLERVDEVLAFHFFEAFWAVDRFRIQALPVADVGSGAGFPGVAMKLYAPSLSLTVIEQNLKKAVFLRELSRTLGLTFSVYPAAAETWPGWGEIRLATMRALRPSPKLLGILAENAVSLLLFHGAAVDPHLESWIRVQSCACPLSRERRITFFQPPGNRST